MRRAKRDSVMSLSPPLAARNKFSPFPMATCMGYHTLNSKNYATKCLGMGYTVYKEHQIVRYRQCLKNWWCTYIQLLWLSRLTLHVEIVVAALCDPDLVPAALLLLRASRVPHLGHHLVETVVAVEDGSLVFSVDGPLGFILGGIKQQIKLKIRNCLGMMKNESTREKAFQPKREPCYLWDIACPLVLVRWNWCKIGPISYNFNI